jgi:hypothetical protein
MEQRDPAGDERMLQGRLWTQRVPRRALPRDAAEQRYEWWRRLHPRLFDPQRYARGQAPAQVGKGCMVCLMDTRDTSLDRCPRCGRRLIWVSFAGLPY